MYHSQTMLKLCPLSWRELDSWYMCMGACVSMCMCRCLLGHVCACYELCEEGKKRESLNVTLLSTVTMLTTCDVSGRIIVAHWACAEQAPSTPRVLRICTRYTRGWACTDPQRVENATLITFFFCYAQCLHPLVVFVIVLTVCSLLFQHHHYIDSLTWQMYFWGAAMAPCDINNKWQKARMKHFMVGLRACVSVKLCMKTLITLSALPPNSSQVKLPECFSSSHML